ncbi:hypothetical protein [Streptomyces sp. NPDC058401]|uniref:hypothetical protein n=1 Tax=Streptomyces sp. NPDC058401 TaxID=3346480 RepID=UPI00366335F9
MGPRTTHSALAAAGGVLAALTLAAAPAPAARPGAAARCTPSLRVLERLPVVSEDPHPSPWVRRTQVNALAEGMPQLAVGMSQLEPVYWIGTRVHRLPLPAGSGSGRVTDVNRHGLMVGYANTPGGSIAFSYRPGDRAVTVLPGGGAPRGVNDHGVVVGDVWDPVRNRTVGMEWRGGRLLRELEPPAGYRLHQLSGINNAGEVVGSGASEPSPGTPDGSEPSLYWPADRSAAASVLAPGAGSNEPFRASGIDERGRIVGYTWTGAGPDHHEESVVWNTPGSPASRPAMVTGARTSTLDGTSPRTGVAVGLASFPVDPPLPADRPAAQAQYLAGNGPVRVLPGLTPAGYSVAFAASDDDRVGGTALDAQNRPQPVIWTCASRQAYVRP